MARQEPDERAPRLVLADWLEEHGHSSEAWRERLHGLTGRQPTLDADTGTLRTGQVPMGQGAWRQLLVAPPPEDLLCVFARDVRAYRYLEQYRGRCGWELGHSDWSSKTESAHLLAVPRLEMLACTALGPGGWDWIMNQLPGLTHFEAVGPQIDAARFAGLKRLPRLRNLLLDGHAARDLTALGRMPGLRHLSLGPFSFEASQLAAYAPELESLPADLVSLEGSVPWPHLRSLQMLPRGVDDSSLKAKEVKALVRYPLLERLNLRLERTTAAAVEALAGLPRLRELALRVQKGPLSSLKALAGAPALESLTLEGPLREDHLREIGTFTGLRVLSLNKTPIGGLDLDAVAEMSQLEELRLQGDLGAVHGLSALAALPRLRKLDVQSLTLSAETARALKAACPPWVECLIPANDS